LLDKAGREILSSANEDTVIKKIEEILQ